MSESKDDVTIVQRGDGHFSAEVLVVNPMGLHARPASMLVGLANKYPCDIIIGRGDLRVDGKSILQLLSLSAEAGSVLSLEARGSEALSAVQALTELVRNGFHEVAEGAGAQRSSARDVGA